MEAPILIILLVVIILQIIIWLGQQLLMKSFIMFAKAVDEEAEDVNDILCKVLDELSKRK